MKKDKSILVIDDDAEIVSMIKEVLEEEYNVITAYNGQEGLHKYSMQKFDLVISDFKMPKMPGDKLIHYVRELEKKNKSLINPIFMITGDKILASRKLKEDPLVYILEKPFDFKLLLKLVKKLFDDMEKKSKPKT